MGGLLSVLALCASVAVTDARGWMLVLYADGLGMGMYVGYTQEECNVAREYAKQVGERKGLKVLAGCLEAQARHTTESD
jgi:hypothetical protein